MTASVLGAPSAGIWLHRNITQTCWVGGDAEKYCLAKPLQQQIPRSVRRRLRFRQTLLCKFFCRFDDLPKVVGVLILKCREQVAVTSGYDVIAPCRGVDRFSVVGLGVAVGLTWTGWRNPTNDESCHLHSHHHLRPAPWLKCTLDVHCLQRPQRRCPCCAAKLRNRDDGFIFGTTGVDACRVIRGTNDITGT